MRKRRYITRKEVEIILKKYNIEISGKYWITNEGYIDIDGDLIIKFSSLQKLPLKFGRIYGDFNCSGLQLDSLKGSPIYVSGDFNCKENNLTSLKHGPKYVGNNYDCSHNNLESLKGCAKDVGRDLLCNNNNLVNLIGSPKIIQGYFNCKLNKLKSLVGSPKVLYGRFHISHNRINNFEGAPSKMIGEIYATSNFLNNLKGLSSDFEGVLFIDASAKSINTGLIDLKKMKLQLRTVNKYGHNFMPPQIMDNHKNIDLILQFQKYYEIWHENDELDNEQFSILIEDINDGLL